MRAVKFTVVLLAAALLSGCAGTSMTIGGSSGAFMTNGYSSDRVLANGSITANSGVDQSVQPMSQYQADLHKCAIYKAHGQWQEFQTCQRNLAENYYSYGAYGYGSSMGYTQQLLYQQQLQQREMYLQQQMLLRQQMVAPAYRPIAYSPTEAQVEDRAARLAQSDRYMPFELQAPLVSCKLGADGIIHYVRAELCQGYGDQIVPIPGPGLCYTFGKVQSPQACWLLLLKEEEAKRGYGLVKFGQ